MKIERVDVFEGPNVYCLRPTARLLLDLGPLDGVESRAVPGFDAALRCVLPRLGDHFCSRGRAGGFGERLREGTWFGHVVEHVALELLAQAGLDVRYGRTRRHSGSVFSVVFEHGGPMAAHAAAEHAVALVADLLAGNMASARQRLADVAEAVSRERLGPSTLALWTEARRRGVPVRRLGPGNLLELGQGIHRRRLWATLGDRTSAVAVDVAGDKLVTKRLLAEAGVPVPDGLAARDEEEATLRFFQLGPPVAVKPGKGNQGRGVSVGLTSEAAVRHAFRLAAAEARSDESILVERHVNGRCFRVLVVGGHAVAATERIPPSAVGDGVSTVAALVHAMNRDPRRGDGHERPLTRIPLDAIALASLGRQGYDATSIPAAGERVWLRDSANLSTGGSARDATDELHPAVARVCERAARAVGLDVAGVDLVAPGLDRPLAETGGAVIEVNASPGLRMHLDPDRGLPQPVAARILDAVMGPGPGRIPVIAVTGTNGKTTTARLIARILERAGWTVGLAVTGGVRVGDDEIFRGDTTGPASARMVLGDPRVEAAVLETARGGIIRGGLGFDACDVAVITNIAEDHLGQDGIESVDDLVWVKSLVADVVAQNGWLVLNADDPRTASIARGRSRRVAWFSRVRPPAEESAAAELLVHAGAGGFWVRRGGAETFLAAFADLPSTWQGALVHQTENAAAAAAAALALGVPTATVARALADFGERDNPGRFQVHEVRGVKVVVDYGHNPPAWTTILPAARSLGTGELWGVIGVPGDRRDDLIRESGRTAARWCSRLVIKEDRDLRGRQPGEVAGLLREGALAAGFAPDRIEVVPDEAHAVRRTLERAAEGDTVIVFYEHLESILDVLRESGTDRVPAGSAAAARSPYAGGRST